MMAELLRSGNAPKILFLMMRSFASRSDENVKFLMKTITELANTTIDRANTAVLKKQKVIESMEAIMPPGLARYPYGNAGVLTYILSQCNFKELYNPEQPYLALASRYMTGSPMGRMMIPQFKELLDKGVTIRQVSGKDTLLTIAPADGSYKVDFGREEFETYFKGFLRPQLVEMLF